MEVIIRRVFRLLSCYLHLSTFGMSHFELAFELPLFIMPCRIKTNPAAAISAQISLAVHSILEQTVDQTVTL